MIDAAVDGGPNLLRDKWLSTASRPKRVIASDGKGWTVYLVYRPTFLAVLTMAW